MTLMDMLRCDPGVWRLGKWLETARKRYSRWKRKLRGLAMTPRKELS
jgi:hypothetical protein